MKFDKESQIQHTYVAITKFKGKKCSQNYDTSLYSLSVTTYPCAEGNPLLSDQKEILWLNMSGPEDILKEKK